ncbi:hypothetical protein VE03_04615 [Pseudogymnoascus sp. 23342-1-I1]|nr:hypothetical protein VE03_04615 [Pseudogymnoascus sp. 23342-1-I1]
MEGLSVRSDIDILQWRTVGGALLKEAGILSLSAEREREIEIACVVPFSLPTQRRSGQLVYIPSDIQITEASVKGKVVLEDFPVYPIPYLMIVLLSYLKTADLNSDPLRNYDCPGLEEMPLKEELTAAGAARAAGMIVMFKFLDSYFEPHQGVHYRLPAMFVKADEASLLKAAAEGGGEEDEEGSTDCNCSTDEQPILIRQANSVDEIHEHCKPSREQVEQTGLRSSHFFFRKRQQRQPVFWRVFLGRALQVADRPSGRDKDMPKD